MKSALPDYLLKILALKASACVSDEDRAEVASYERAIRGVGLAPVVDFATGAGVGTDGTNGTDETNGFPRWQVSDWDEYGMPVAFTRLAVGLADFEGKRRVWTVALGETHCWEISLTGHRYNPADYAPGPRADVAMCACAEFEEKMGEVL
ncbi:hypothetical protein OpiT1DRAFT_05272 [Opitutaceae bacterium TAV1]|nr:hypothetical protein OpiT1DRAFT_05272 [Opitutaceae bacterium TAV1]